MFIGVDQQGTITNKTVVSSNRGGGAGVSNVLTRTVPSWPEGAVSFSIDAKPQSGPLNSTNEYDSANKATEYVTQLGVTGKVDTLPVNSDDGFGTTAEWTAIGPVLYHKSELFGLESVNKVYWAGGTDATNKTFSTSADGKSEIPLMFSGDAQSVGQRDYLYDFGLIKCNNADCSNYERVATLNKDANNEHIHFHVSTTQINTSTNAVSEDQVAELPFLIAFSGRWHF